MGGRFLKFSSATPRGQDLKGGSPVRSESFDSKRALSWLVEAGHERKRGHSPAPHPELAPPAPRVRRTTAIARC